MKNNFFCLESGPGKDEYVKIWNLAKNGHDPEGWLLIQSGSECIVGALYALIGLKVIGSYSYAEVKNKMLKTNREVLAKINYDQNERLTKLSDIVSYIDSTEFKDPM